MRLKTSLMKELYTFTIRFHRIPCVCTIFQAPAAKANIPERHWGWHIPVNDRLCLFSILYITNQSTMEILKSSSEMRISRIHLPCHVWEPPIQDRFWFYCMVNKVTLLPSPASKFLMGQLSYLALPISSYQRFQNMQILHFHLSWKITRRAPQEFTLFEMINVSTGARRKVVWLVKL